MVVAGGAVVTGVLEVVVGRTDEVLVLVLVVRAVVLVVPG